MNKIRIKICDEMRGDQKKNPNKFEFHYFLLFRNVI